MGAINSINWARILAQTTYYFYSFFSVLKQQGVPANVASYLALAKIQYSVPSGNFGDVLAGFYAKQMGLPIHGFIVATNENDILDRFLKTGVYDRPEKKEGAPDPVKQTLSPAMDILISSNFERLLWYVCQEEEEKGIALAPSTVQAEKASQVIHSYFDQLKKKGSFKVSPRALAKAQSLFSSHRVTDRETSDAIKRYFHHQYSNNTSRNTTSTNSSSKNDADPSFYILDPHTAVGVVSAEVILEKQAASTGVHTIVLSTASPGKFPAAVLEAINSDPPLESTQQGFTKVDYVDIAPKELVDLEGKPQRMTLVQSNGGKLEIALRRVRQTIIATLGGHGKL